MQMRVLSAASILILLSSGFIFSSVNKTLAQFPDATSPPPEDTPLSGERALFLEVFLNGESTELIAEFRQDANGSFFIEPQQLRNVGIEAPQEAIGADGLVDVAKLSGIAYEYDEASQSIRFSADFDSLSTRVIDAHQASQEKEESAVQNSLGALVNYTIYASTNGDRLDDMWSFEGVSGLFETRAFSALGVVSSSFVVNSSPNDYYKSTRLDTTWSYSHPATMLTYRAGDVISGGLPWTRPVRLGGLQIQRNFDLRPDLVTMPLPEISGSAAVPSTVDVYVNDARRLSREVPTGPFQITNLPVVTGSGVARIVVRDALGRETVSESPFFASSDLLSPGLWDFSAEAGFARRFFGTESNDYDKRIFGSATARVGLTDWNTLEAHAEGGGGLLNGGAGMVFGVGPYGLGTVSAAASTYEGETGFQVSGSLEMSLGDVNLFGRTQRTFGQYNDIAGVTAYRRDDTPPELRWFSSAPPKALDQISVSTPLYIDPATLTFTYTRLETADEERAQTLSLSLNRQIGTRASVYATAFKDLEDRDSFGAFAGLSISFGEHINAATSVSHNRDGTAVTADIARSMGGEIGDYGWRIRDTEGAYVNRAASGSYRTPIAKLEAGVQQFDKDFRVSGQVDGAAAIAGEGVFFSNRIDEAFAVVDTGAPDVEVQYENRPAGRTNRSGKLLIPNLRSYEPNRITISPENLPLDASISGTHETAVPADRSGAVVKFKVETHSQAALITFRDEAGNYLGEGSSGKLEGTSESFVVGYDGQAYIPNLGSRNRVVIEQSDKAPCTAEFSFEAREGEQVQLPDTVCRIVN
jgi:outer membrane usher protein